MNDVLDWVLGQARAWFGRRENVASVVSTLVSGVIFVVCWFLARWVFSP